MGPAPAGIWTMFYPGQVSLGSLAYKPGCIYTYTLYIYICMYRYVQFVATFEVLGYLWYNVHYRGRYKRRYCRHLTVRISIRRQRCTRPPSCIALNKRTRVATPCCVQSAG